MGRPSIKGIWIKIGSDPILHRKDGLKVETYLKMGRPRIERFLIKIGFDPILHKRWTRVEGILNTIGL